MLNQTEFLWAFFGVTFIISLIISFKMNTDLHRNLPHLKGYVIGYICATWPMVVLAAFFAFAMYVDRLGDLIRVPDVLASVISLTIFSALGVGIIKRNRWAFLAYIILIFAPLAWIFLGIYLYRRWHEMKTEFVFVPHVEVVKEEET